MNLISPGTGHVIDRRRTRNRCGGSASTRNGFESFHGIYSLCDVDAEVQPLPLAARARIGAVYHRAEISARVDGGVFCDRRTEKYPPILCVYTAGSAAADANQNRIPQN